MIRIAFILTLLFSLSGPVLGENGAFGENFNAPSRTNAGLLQEIADRAGRQSFEGTARVQGTLRHSYADRLLTRYQRLYGDRGLNTEIRYLDGVPNQGGLGSIRLDVVEGDLLNPSAIFDYKFGRSGLSPARIDQIRGVGGFADDVPIWEIRPR